MENKGEVGGGYTVVLGTGKGTGKSMRKSCQNDPLAKQPYEFLRLFFQNNLKG